MVLAIDTPKLLLVSMNLIKDYLGRRIKRGRIFRENCSFV